MRLTAKNIKTVTGLKVLSLATRPVVYLIGYRNEWEWHNTAAPNPRKKNYDLTIARLKEAFPDAMIRGNIVDGIQISRSWPVRGRLDMLY